MRASNKWLKPTSPAFGLRGGLAQPVLLLQGGRSNVRSWFHACVRHVAEHVPQATVHEFADLGHLAPMVAPEPIAEKIARFFDTMREPA